MRRAQITLRLLVAAVLACGLLGGLAGSATAQDEPVQVTVYKLFCEDKNRVGQTDFLVGTAPFELETSSLTGAQAFQESDTSVDCTEEVPDDEPQPSFTLTNVDEPEDSDTQTVDPVTGTAVFAEVEPGTYELLEDDGPTSEPFTVEADVEQ